MSQISNLVLTERPSLVRRVWRFIGSWALAESIVAIVGIILGLSLTSVVAKVPLLGFSALLLVLVATAKLQRERQQDEHERERDAQLKRMEDALSNTPIVASPPLLPSDSATVEALREHTAALREVGRQTRYTEIKQTLAEAMADREEAPIIGRSSRAARRSRLAYEEARKARHLEPKYAAAIIRKVSEGVSKLDAEWLAATPSVVIPPIPIVLVAIGTDPETLNYRRALADAFSGGGLRIIYQQWLAGSPEYEQFVGAVTLLEDKPTNKVRPFIIDALRAAGINPHEAPWPVRLRVPGHYDDDARLWLLIGQCR